MAKELELEERDVDDIMQIIPAPIGWVVRRRFEDDGAPYPDSPIIALARLRGHASPGKDKDRGQVAFVYCDPCRDDEEPHVLVRECEPEDYGGLVSSHVIDAAGKVVWIAYRKP